MHAKVSTNVGGNDGSVGKEVSQRVTGTYVDDPEVMALGGQDLNRITPKAFLRIPTSRHALVRELVGLAKIDCHGNPAMSIAHGFDQWFAGLKGYTQR